MWGNQKSTFIVPYTGHLCFITAQAKCRKECFALIMGSTRSTKSSKSQEKLDDEVTPRRPKYDRIIRLACLVNLPKLRVPNKKSTLRTHQSMRAKR
eukprot:3108908-Amphidinium_carterae.2